jgi:hypothetical protein
VQSSVAVQSVHCHFPDNKSHFGLHVSDPANRARGETSSADSVRTGSESSRTCDAMNRKRLDYNI